MKVTNCFYFLGTKTGKKKDGTDWTLVQTLDNDGKHFNYFTTKSEFYNDLNIDDEFKLTLNIYYDLKRKTYRFIPVEVSK